MIIPAAPGTFLVERDAGTVPPRVIRVPVIAWDITDEGKAWPVTALDGPSIGAVLHPSGYVDEPKGSLTFSNETEWLAFLDSPDPGPRGYPADPEMPEDDPELATEIEGRKMAAKFLGEDQPAPIKFGKKTFKTKSFWLAEEHQAVFSIEGGQPVPDDDRCLKIIRDTFVAHKRDGLPEINPHDGEVEDDGMDLV